MNEKKFKLALLVAVSAFASILVAPLFLEENTSHAKIIYQEVKTKQDIKIVEKEVLPIVYTNTIDLDNLPILEKKEKFISLLLPSILIAKSKLTNTQKQVQDLMDKKNITKEQEAFLKKLLKEYNAHNLQELLKKLKTNPTSLVLAQAAIKSNWGSSRFFLEANNVFGIWSFNKNENRILALEDEEDKKVYFKKYNSIEEAIEDYFLTIANCKNFKDLKNEEQKTNNHFKPTKYLAHCSELEETYVEHLNAIIKDNNLTKYDSYKLKK